MNRHERRVAERGYSAGNAGIHRGSKKGYRTGCFGNKKPLTPEPYKAYPNPEQRQTDSLPEGGAV